MYQGVVREKGSLGFEVLRYVVNSWGDKLDPCGTHVLIVLKPDVLLPAFTRKFLLNRKDFMVFVSCDGTPVWVSWKISPSCQTLSNAFSMPSRTAVVFDSLVCVICDVVDRVKQ